MASSTEARLFRARMTKDEKKLRRAQLRLLNGQMTARKRGSLTLSQIYKLRRAAAVH